MTGPVTATIDLVINEAGKRVARYVVQILRSNTPDVTPGWNCKTFRNGGLEIRICTRSEWQTRALIDADTMAPFALGILKKAPTPAEIWARVKNHPMLTLPRPVELQVIEAAEVVDADDRPSADCG